MTSSWFTCGIIQMQGTGIVMLYLSIALAHANSQNSYSLVNNNQEYWFPATWYFWGSVQEKTVMTPSYLHNGHLCTGNMASFY